MYSKNIDPHSCPLANIQQRTENVLTFEDIHIFIYNPVHLCWYYLYKVSGIENIIGKFFCKEDEIFLATIPGIHDPSAVNLT